MLNLKPGNFIIALEDLIIPSTGITFFFFKGYKYKIVEYYPLWNGWCVLSEKKRDIYGIMCNNAPLSEEYIIKNFDYIRCQRKEKLQKLNLIK